MFDVDSSGDKFYLVMEYVAGVSFRDLRARLAARRWPTLTYGGWVTLITWLPLANLFLLPGAGAAGVLMWDRHYRGLETVAPPQAR